MANEKQDIILQAVGDVAVNRDDPPSIFKHVVETLSKADILFGNCETPYSERGSPNPIARGALRSHPKNISALTFAGFDVMSFANNHHLDWGYDAFNDTLDLVRKAGISLVGAGREIEEARRPAVIDSRGNRVAFLGYSSVNFLGYEAGANKAGAVPMKAHTIYQQIEDEQPGTDPRIITVADPDDLEALKNDVRNAKNIADIVVVSIHWGLHFVPARLAMYESEVAKAAIDSGADLILGHHQHILKGVNVYRGKVIFHGLCNFALDMLHKKELMTPRRQFLRERYAGLTGFDPQYPGYPYLGDARKTIIAKVTIGGQKIKGVSFLPALINKNSEPEILPAGEAAFEDVWRYMERITRDAGLTAEFTVDRGEVIVST